MTQLYLRYLTLFFNLSETNKNDECYKDVHSCPGKQQDIHTVGVCELQTRSIK